MDDDEEVKAFAEELRGLSHGPGVQRDSWQRVLTPRLRKTFEIVESDHSTRVREKVTWHLDAATMQLLEPNRILARYSFNITGDPKIDTMKNMEDRQKAVCEFIKPDFRTIKDVMTKAILPELAKIFVHHPPGPMPTRELRTTQPGISNPSDVNAPDEAKSEAKKPSNRSDRKLVGIAVGSALFGSLLTWGIPLLGGDTANTATNAPNQPTDVMSNTSPGAQGERNQSPNPTATGLSLVFDDLGGGDPTVMVYPGVTASDQDKLQNGTFKSGDAMPALCKKKGRSVPSHPELGEQTRNMNDWIRIHGTPGTIQYAPATYVKDPDILLSKLPHCT